VDAGVELVARLDLGARMELEDAAGAQRVRRAVGEHHLPGRPRERGGREQGKAKRDQQLHRAPRGVVTPPSREYGAECEKLVARTGSRRSPIAARELQALALSRSRISVSSVSSFVVAGGAGGAACFWFMTKPRNLTMKMYSASATTMKFTISPMNSPYGTSFAPTTIFQPR